MNLVMGVVDAVEIIPYKQQCSSIYKGRCVSDEARDVLGYIEEGLEEERTEVVIQQEVTENEITEDEVNLPDMNASTQLSSLQQLVNVESDFLVKIMGARQDTDLISCSYGVKEEENFITDTAKTVDIPQFDATQHGMSSDNTEFLAEGTRLGEEQVEKTSTEERAAGNIFPAESFLHAYWHNVYNCLLPRRFNKICLLSIHHDLRGGVNNGTFV